LEADCGRACNMSACNSKRATGPNCNRLLRQDSRQIWIRNANLAALQAAQRWRSRRGSKGEGVPIAHQHLSTDLSSLRADWPGRASRRFFEGAPNAAFPILERSIRQFGRPLWAPSFFHHWSGGIGAARTRPGMANLELRGAKNLIQIGNRFFVLSSRISAGWKRILDALPWERNA